MQFSVIIPTCSPAIPLKACLDSLCHQTLSREKYEIIVVNNGGAAHSKKLLEPLLADFSDRVRLIEAGGNRAMQGGAAWGSSMLQAGTWPFTMMTRLRIRLGLPWRSQPWTGRLMRVQSPAVLSVWTAL
ncbi:MAG: glycosyltransferase [Candidatus Omnitrophica bacterium]|nr:glycosyltransferase [Candidatus Omnitrophota bacterium]